MATGNWKSASPTGKAPPPRRRRANATPPRPNDFSDRLAAASIIAQRCIDKLNPVICNVLLQQALEATPNRLPREIPEGEIDGLSSAQETILATRGATGALQHLLNGTLATAVDKMRLFQGIKLQNKVIKSTRGAQCGELSAYVYYRCHKEGFLPVHRIMADNVELFNRPDNHAFVAIGLNNPGQQSDMRSWPDDVVICDPWVMQLIRGTPKAVGKTPGAYTVAQYLALVQPYFHDGGKVIIMSGMEAPLGVPVNPVIGGARAPFVTSEMMDRTTPEYQNGYEFARKSLSKLDQVLEDPEKLWNFVVAQKTQAGACKLVGVPNPPDWDDQGQVDKFSRFQDGCIAGNKSG